jgi:hypothetical protein
MLLPSSYNKNKNESSRLLLMPVFTPTDYTSLHLTHQISSPVILFSPPKMSQHGQLLMNIVRTSSFADLNLVMKKQLSELRRFCFLFCPVSKMAAALMYEIISCLFSATFKYKRKNLHTVLN